MDIVFPLSTNRIIVKKVDIYDKIIEILLANKWSLIHSFEDGSKVIKSPAGSYIKFYPYYASAVYDIRTASSPYSFIGLEPLYGFENGESVRVENKYAVSILDTLANQNMCQLTWYIDDISFIFIGKSDPPSISSHFFAYGLPRDSMNPNRDPRVDSVLWSDYLYTFAGTSVSSKCCVVLDYPNSAPGLQNNSSVIMYNDVPEIFSNLDGLGRAVITNIKYGNSNIGILGYLWGVYAIPGIDSRSVGALKDGDKIKRDGKLYEALYCPGASVASNLVGTVNYAIQIYE